MSDILRLPVARRREPDRPSGCVLIASTVIRGVQDIRADETPSSLGNRVAAGEPDDPLDDAQRGRLDERGDDLVVHGDLEALELGEAGLDHSANHRVSFVAREIGDLQDEESIQD